MPVLQSPPFWNQIKQNAALYNLIAQCTASIWDNPPHFYRTDFSKCIPGKGKNWQSKCHLSFLLKEREVVWSNTESLLPSQFCPSCLFRENKWKDSCLKVCRRKECKKMNKGPKKHAQKYKSTLNWERSMEKQYIMTFQNYPKINPS